MIAVNKMDHPAAKTMVADVRSILALDHDRDWKPPIVLTEALREEGVEALWDRLAEHRSHLETGRAARRAAAEHLAAEVFAVSSARAKTHLERAVHDDPELARVLEAVQRRELDPLSAVDEILEKVFGLTHPTAADVERARERLAGVARVTPIVRSATFSRPRRP